MATILKRTVNGNEYHYMSYSYRKNDKVLKKEKYLGAEIPPFEELTQLWEAFSYEIAEERWLQEVDAIKETYCEILDSTPLSIIKKNLKNFGIHFTHNTNKIEGSSLNLRDVERVLKDDKLPKNRKPNDIIETKAHMKIYEEMLDTDNPLSMGMICNWHKNLFQLTDSNIAGLIRDYPVGISGSDYEPPYSKIEIEQLLKDLFEWYEKNKDTYNPVFIAAIMHYRFIAIHPFGDGNGRMTRLMTNYILYKNEYPMFDISADIRYKYYKALAKTDKKEHDLPFVLWFFKSYIESNKKYLR
ncbi:MAG: Fic family protein [Promethearchaeia archaeon]